MLKKICALAFAASAWATTCNISDTLTTPFGGTFAGKVYVSLSAPGSAQPLYSGSVTLTGWQATIDVPASANGAVSLSLTCTDSITPAGTSYSARYQPTSGAAWVETWTPATGTTTIRAMRATTVPTPTTTFQAGQLALASGSLLYGASTGVGAALGIGSTGQVLGVSAGLPAWVAAPACSTCVTTSGSYADPAWITSLSGNKISGNISGSAATLTTARLIAGVSFNGSADIAIPSTGLADSSNVARLNTAQSFSAKQTFTPSATVAGMNVGVRSAAPSAPVQGDVFFNSTLTRKGVYDGTQWRYELYAPSSGTGIVSWDGTSLSASSTITATLTGNSSTATALAANGTNCSAGSFPLGVDASGNSETCTALPTTISGTANQITASASTGAVTLSLPATITGLTSVTSTSFTGALTGNASTATALSSTVASGRLWIGQGTGVPTSDANLAWDSANGRLGVGTGAPSVTLQSAGMFGVTSGTFVQPTGVGGLFFNYATATDIASITAVTSGTSGRTLRLFGYPLIFGSSQTAGEFGRFASISGNLLIGTTTDGNYKLDVANSGSSGMLRVYNQTAVTGSTLAVIQAGAGQSGNLQEWRNNAGTVLGYVNSSGQFGTLAGGAIKSVLYTSLALASDSSMRWNSTVDLAGGTVDVAVNRNAAGVLGVTNGSSTNYVLLGATSTFFDATATTGVSKVIVKAGAGQSTTNLQEWQNSSGTVVASIGSLGGADFNVGTSSFTLTAAGIRYVRAIDSTSGFQLNSGWGLKWGAGAADSTPDTGMLRNAAGVLEVNNGTAGTYRDILARRHQASGETVASLPAAAAGNAGTISYVTDANATTIGSTVAGGGANKVLVWSNGTAWKIFAN